MTQAVNLASLPGMNGGQSSNASDRTGSGKGPEVLVAGDIAGKTDFKTLLSSSAETGKEGSVKGKDSPESQIFKLLKFLELSESEQKKILEGFDPDKLKELEQLLAVFLQRLQQEAGNLNQGNMNLKELLELNSSNGKNQTMLSDLQHSLLKLKKMIKIISQESPDFQVKADGDDHGFTKDNQISDKSTITDKPASTKDPPGQIFNENKNLDPESSRAENRVIPEDDKDGSNLKRAGGKHLVNGRNSGKKSETNPDRASFMKINNLADRSKTIHTQNNIKSENLFHELVKPTSEDFTRQQNSGREESFNESGFLKSNPQARFNANSAEPKAAPARMKMAEVVKQITDQIRITKPGKNELEIKLEPRSLGRVKVTLKLEAGEILARMSVENQAVKNYLEHNLSTLKSNLIRQGFTVDQIQIESDSFNSEQQQEMDLNQQFNGQQHNQSKNGHNEGQPGEEFMDLSYDELEDLIKSSSDELLGSLLKDKQWLNYQYYGYHRMNLLA